MAVTREDVVAFLSRLGPGELQELILELEDRWGMEPAYVEQEYVTMGAPVVQGIEMGIPEFEVVLLWSGPQRVQVMKTLREVTPTLTLGEVMVMIEQTPSVVLRGVHREVHALRMELEALGAKVEIR
ncbi:ribosomal protein L7/L12 [Nannocystis bainbridge]|uniref:Ribosomal protein L7/L12 n=1 Tax=Nannocystis bainbridge TaxID=2995303 RepID=A0ABT5EBJ5_9BACT|nr:ribosomal protein L7/L12 [Nannocystis bainbridge]MDC0723229.1 ribosomal protein L7/L12 [Nannocystis bainbridge]